MVTSDFNKDSHLDLAIAENGSYFLDEGGVQMMLGAGDGSFIEANEYSANDGPVALAAADFNTDGHPDLAVANNSSGDVSVLLGGGDGGFGGPTNIPTGPSPSSVVAAFFNDDGHPDLAVAADPPSSPNVSILLGKGDGSFTSPRRRERPDQQPRRRARPRPLRQRKRHRHRRPARPRPRLRASAAIAMATRVRGAAWLACLWRRELSFSRNGDPGQAPGGKENHHGPRLA